MEGVGGVGGCRRLLFDAMKVLVAILRRNVWHLSLAYSILGI